MYVDLNIFTKRCVLQDIDKSNIYHENSLIFRNLYSKLSIFLSEQEATLHGYLELYVYFVVLQILNLLGGCITRYTREQIVVNTKFWATLPCILFVFHVIGCKNCSEPGDSEYSGVENTDLITQGNFELTHSVL